MMKVLGYIFLVLLSVFFLAGCNHSSLAPETNSPIEDNTELSVQQVSYNRNIHLDIGYSLNGHNPGQGTNLNLYDTYYMGGYDPEQRWDIRYRYDGTVTLRRTGTNYCINANSPAEYSNVNMWYCDSSDSDQRFVLDWNSGLWKIRRLGTNLCLTAQSLRNSGNVYLRECKPSLDYRQLFQE